MTTVVAYDLFLDKKMIIENETTNLHNVTLTVVGNDNFENEINNNKAENENSKNEILEIKNLKNENLFSRNQNPKIKNPENEKIKRDMVKGYMQLLSNFQN